MRQIKSIMPAPGWRAFVKEQPIPVVGWAVVEGDEVVLMVWLGQRVEFIDWVEDGNVQPPIAAKK